MQHPLGSMPFTESGSHVPWVPVAVSGMESEQGMKRRAAEERLAWAVVPQRSPRVERSRISPLPPPASLFISLLSNCTHPRTYTQRDKRFGRTHPSRSPALPLLSVHGRLRRLLAAALAREPAKARWRPREGPRGGDPEGTCVGIGGR
jgi:hypothetical protein